MLSRLNKFPLNNIYIQIISPCPLNHRLNPPAKNKKVTPTLKVADAKKDVINYVFRDRSWVL